MKVYFHTLGCRVNQYETDAARELFINAGYEIASQASEADICVVNTCTVTGEADRKSRQQLRRMARINPRAVVVAMGCMSEMSDGVIDADIVCGTKDKTEVVKKVEEYLKDKASALHLHKSSHVRPEVTGHDDYHEFGTVLSPEGTRAFIKIEDGCNKFCSYCIIPFARGRVASRDEENIIEEASFLARKGYREVVLSGIHICSYGKDRGEDISALLRVIKRIKAIEGIERIRLGSMEPKSLTDSFIEGLSTVDKLCPHFHLSLQSGSDTVLTRMNRDYTTEGYLEIVGKLRRVFPGMSLTTDVICGFPGESDLEFEETCEFVKKAGINKIHVFPFSRREGTVAAGMPQLSAHIGKARADILNEYSSRAQEEFAKSKVGQRTGVLIEEYREGMAYGYIPEYIRASIPMDECAFNPVKGKVVDVNVTAASGDKLICEIRQN